MERAIEKIPQNSGIYAGFDPTANSLHIGNLVTLCGLFTAAHHYSIPSIALMGSGTVSIGGDPSFRTSERSKLSADEIAKNSNAISKSIQRIQKHHQNMSNSMKAQSNNFDKSVQSKQHFRILDNSSWLSKISILDFMCTVGHSFRIKNMLERDCIQTRINQHANTATYGEFSYQIIQAYDFLALSQKFNINMQLGGIDQWGNIYSGMELIKRSTGQESVALCTPLLVDSCGKKIGKSENNQIWLDSEKTRPFDFYQVMHFLIM